MPHFLFVIYMYWLYIYSLRFNLKSHHCNYIRHRHIFEQGTLGGKVQDAALRYRSVRLNWVSLQCFVYLYMHWLGGFRCSSIREGWCFFFKGAPPYSSRIYAHTCRKCNMKSFGAHKRICAWWARAHRTHRFLAVCIFTSLLYICIVNQLKPCIMYTHTHTQHISYTFLRIYIYKSICCAPMYTYIYLYMYMRCMFYYMLCHWRAYNKMECDDEEWVGQAPHTHTQCYTIV